jgi:hypothetical protein
MENIIVVVMILTWIEGYICTMRYISVTGGYRDACDYALEMEANKKTFYLSMLVARLLIFVTWPICFMVRAISFSVNGQ